MTRLFYSATEAYFEAKGVPPLKHMVRIDALSALLALQGHREARA